MLRFWKVSFTGSQFNLEQQEHHVSVCSLNRNNLLPRKEEEFGQSCTDGYVAVILMWVQILSFFSRTGVFPASKGSSGRHAGRWISGKEKHRSSFCRDSPPQDYRCVFILVLQPTERITERQRGFFLGIQTSTREPYYHKPIWLQPGKECKPELVLKYRTGVSTEEWISPPGGAQSRAGPNSTWEQRKERRRRKNPYTMTKTEGTKRQITNIEKHQNLNRGTLMAGGHRKLETKVCNQTNKCRTAMTVNRDGLAANKYMGLSLYSVKDCSVSLHH